MTSFPAEDLKRVLSGRLRTYRAKATHDPFTNAYLLFALDLTQSLSSDGLDLGSLERLVQLLGAESFEARAVRLGAYLGDCDPVRRVAEITRLFERIADRGGFEDYASAVAKRPFGVVLTGHPTFSMRQDLSLILVELATGFDAGGAPLTDDERAARLDQEAADPLSPPPELTLEIEHRWSAAALESARRATATIYDCAYAVAQNRWPERWTELRPRLLTLATWVGFDQDGRTDVTWRVSFEKRLDLKRIALAQRLDAIGALLADAGGDWRAALQALTDRLATALATVEGQLAALAASSQDAAQTPAFARALVDGREAALVESGPLVQLIEAALDHAPDDASRRTLMSMRAALETNGLSAARIHVRLNSGQLHNAVRRDTDLHSDPNDPANRRTYFAAIERLIDQARPIAINLGDLLDEPASARRLMMTLAQMRKFIDASTPVRFLIAETETGFTLLAALYFARLFDVEAFIEISPLFETEEALERGERVLEEALRSAHFRDHLQSHGRLAIEFGFSDSGRFIGQMAATFRIERLRLRLAQMLERQGLTGVEVVFFNTHGESIGRGGHPRSLSDRFRYAAPPRSRAEFAGRGVAVKEEDAFQGGEGYLPLMTPTAALTTLGAALQSVLDDDPEADGDPIYDDSDFASEFFATTQQAFTGLVADPDYAALVGLFGTHLLPKTGSRPTQRQTGDGGRPAKLRSVSELRAIPNNGVLQQLGYLANTLFGVGLAARKDVEAFKAMQANSPRFRRALQMVQSAYDASDLAVLAAYAATLDPALWLDRAKQDGRTEVDLRTCEVAERAGFADAMARVLRRIAADDLSLRTVVSLDGEERAERLALLHALRLGLIQQVGLLCVQFPDFNPREGVTKAALQERLLRLDIAGALDSLEEIFPRLDKRAEQADFGESSAYDANSSHAYRQEHETVFTPLRRLQAMILALSEAITLEIGACG